MKNRDGRVHMAALMTVSMLFAPTAFGADLSTTAITRGQIEADWLRQDVVRRLSPAQSKRHTAAVTAQQDAAGGCDGVRNGTYGFHTG